MFENKLLETFWSWINFQLFDVTNFSNSLKIKLAIF